MWSEVCIYLFLTGIFTVSNTDFRPHLHVSFCLDDAQGCRLCWIRWWINNVKNMMYAKKMLENIFVIAQLLFTVRRKMLLWHGLRTWRQDDKKQKRKSKKIFARIQKPVNTDSYCNNACEIYWEHVYYCNLLIPYS